MSRQSHRRCWTSATPPRRLPITAANRQARYNLVGLGEERADASALKALLVPYPSEEMTCWPVSARVGNVKNNDPSLIEAIAA